MIVDIINSMYLKFEVIYCYEIIILSLYPFPLFFAFCSFLVFLFVLLPFFLSSPSSLSFSLSLFLLLFIAVVAYYFFSLFVFEAVEFWTSRQCEFRGFSYNNKIFSDF